jgi:hypothetical protein
MWCGLLSTRAGRYSPFAGIWTEFKGRRGTKSKRTRMRNAWPGLGDRWNKRPASCLIMKNSEDHLWSGRD